MKTIAEVVGGTLVDWRKELKLARRRSIKSPKTLRLHNLSGSWMSCAVGQQDARLLGSDAWAIAPDDYELYKLGMDFCRAVKENLFSKALGVLIQIEARAKELVDKLPAAE